MLKFDKAQAFPTKNAFLTEKELKTLHPSRVAIAGVEFLDGVAKC